MSKPAGKGRRQSANERYRESFLLQASADLRGFAQLLTEEPDAQESVAFELTRLCQTAETLDLGVIAKAAAEAAEELAAPETGIKALRRVANAIRHTGGRLRFGPICLVGVTGQLAQRLEQDAELCCEPVVLYEDLVAFASGLHTEQPTAVVLPADSPEAAGQLVSRESFPVLVHGAADTWEQHGAAMVAGAHGYLPHPFTLADVTRLTRWKAQRLDEPFDVLLAMDADPSRDALVATLSQIGMGVVVASDPGALSTALEQGGYRAVVLGAMLSGYPAQPLALLVRSHPRCNHLPILVLGRPEDAVALRSVGVDDVMKADAQPLPVAQRIRDRVNRIRALPWDRDPTTRMPTRLGVLNVLDTELAFASRTGLDLSVALIDVAGVKVALEQFGASVLRRLRARMLTVLERNLRRTDAFGELEPGQILVALPGCRQDAASRRIEVLVAQFHQEAADEPQLRNLTLEVGVADTREGLASVAVRAERELRSGAGRG